MTAYKNNSLPNVSVSTRPIVQSSFVSRRFHSSSHMKNYLFRARIQNCSIGVLVSFSAAFYQPLPLHIVPIACFEICCDPCEVINEPTNCSLAVLFRMFWPYLLNVILSIPLQNWKFKATLHGNILYFPRVFSTTIDL